MLHPDSITSRRLRGWRGLLLEVAHPGPPSWPGEGWFGADVPQLDTDELIEERRRCNLRLLLTPRTERDHWPAWWLIDRAVRCANELRARGVRR